MADQTEIHGVAYIFGIQDADAPTVTNMKVRKVELKWASEVKAEAQNGEGHVEAIAVSKAANRMCTATFSGYITTGFKATTLANIITFDSKKFIIDEISEPRNKGEFVEVSISATYHSLIT